ncbi:MAG: segregation/condensation protein A [Deltaproteobacteria bacterium]|nr:segregation/condensation protein A [Deltaproteobacteria bacterium]
MSDDGSELLADSQPDAPGTGAGRAAPYRVKLEVFEGPLDLLLHLIKREEVEVADIPIAAITDQYVAYLDLMRHLNLDIAGEFLVMAATLTLLKSRTLLPQAEGESEDSEETDLRADLVRQLLEYQRFRETAQQLAERPLLNRDVFVREPAWDEVPADPQALPQLRASIWDLMEAFRVVLARARPEAVHEVMMERVSLRERVQQVLRRLSEAKALEFESLFDEDASRLEIIVTFLAVLELCRMQAVTAVQERHFDRIVITLIAADISTVSLDLSDEYDGHVLEEVKDGGGADGATSSAGDGDSGNNSNSDRGGLPTGAGGGDAGDGGDEH